MKLFSLYDLEATFLSEWVDGRVFDVFAWVGAEICNKIQRSESIFCNPVLIAVMFRERENHTAHLASIEAELDNQVAKVRYQCSLE